jgi:uncharacterized protein (DUF1330 family)
MEWDDAKDEARLEEYYRHGPERRLPYFQKKIEEGIVKSAQGWGDGTGHIVFLIEFEDTDAFAKFWADPEWHKITLEFFPLVDNLRHRLMRPGAHPKAERPGEIPKLEE